MTLDTSKVLQVLEAAWRMNEPSDVWLKRVVIAAHEALPADLGTIGVICETQGSSPSARALQPYAHCLREEFYPLLPKLADFATTTNQLRRDFACRRPVATFSSFRCYSQLLEIIGPAQIADVLVIFVGVILGESLSVATVHRQRRYVDEQEMKLLVALSEQLEKAFLCHRVSRAEGASSDRVAAALLPSETTDCDRACELLALGLDYKEIAEALETSDDVARRHIFKAMKACGVHSKEELIVALLSGWRRP